MRQYPGVANQSVRPLFVNILTALGRSVLLTGLERQSGRRRHAVNKRDLENVAQGHPDVMQACVIGVAHPKWDERPLLLIVAAGDKKDKESIYSFLEDKIAKWWKPDDIVFVDELPLGATGKVLKVNLRDQFKDHLMK